MVAVFSIFATLSLIDLKEFGIGLAVAVLIDATIVRAVLLPASMKMLGDWNWWLPRPLRWLPEFRHEPVRLPSRRVRLPDRPTHSQAAILRGPPIRRATRRFAVSSGSSQGA